MPFTVALTGGIGSGKTTIANAFAALGVDIIDADVIAREVVQPGSPALQAIARRHGESILTAEGTLYRARLVDVDEDTQLARTRQRDGVSLSQARSILAAQASRQQRLACADDIIDNSGTPEQVLPRVAELHQRYLQLAATGRD